MKLFLLIAAIQISWVKSFAVDRTNESLTVKAQTTTSVVSKAKVLLVLGDSLTEGYGVAQESAFPFLLEKKLNQFYSNASSWKIINSGISGSTTASAPSRVKWVMRSKPDALLLILGANDGLRGLKVNESEKNLAQAIEFLQKEKIKVILGGLYMPPNYGQKYTTDFKNMYQRLAKKYQLILVPFILDNVAGRSEYNQKDGIHPNEKGHEVIAENIFKVIKGKL
ncbi:MAG: arylesterase [Pseudobdellovibrionaceae bacterium]